MVLLEFQLLLVDLQNQYCCLCTNGFQIPKRVYLLFTFIYSHITFSILLYPVDRAIWRWYDYCIVSYNYIECLCFFDIDRVSNACLSLSVCHFIFYVIWNTIILLVLYSFIIAF